MKLETIMQILYANKMTDVIVLATKIDNDIVDPTEKGIGQSVNVRVHKEGLAALGFQPANEKEREYYFNVLLPVIAVNKYALTEKYLVDMGNGQLKWVAEEGGKYSSCIEPIAETSSKLIEDQTFG